MKNICPICKKEKDSVGPKIINKEEIHEFKFNQPQLSLKTAVMCNDCLEDHKQGRILLNILKNPLDIS